ncbi:MAG: dTDP-4-dehydrorhamnose reductase [Acidobacteria bacterium]|nr:dTDP-4-dehydrorhamnose reductase [Acidobacteriota bacterium]
MSNRAVVIGGGGQLGVELVRVFRARGYDVTALKRADLDITDAARVERTIADLNPAIILNAAAYNQVDVAEREPQAAFLCNGLAVRNLALPARQLDATFVHFSTDYVFDGSKGSPYVEDDPPHPLGAYAVSKLAGELYARAYLERCLIIRTSGVYGLGGMATARGNFVELMLRLAGSGKPIRVVEDHVASPTYAPELASRTAGLVERGLSGTFHIGGGTPISWFDFARLIFEAAGLSPELRATNEREYRSQARRPRYSALSNQKMEADGLAPMPPIRDALRAYVGGRAAAAPAPGPRG